MNWSVTTYDFLCSHEKLSIDIKSLNLRIRRWLLSYEGAFVRVAQSLDDTEELTRTALEHVH